MKRDAGVSPIQSAELLADQESLASTRTTAR